MPPSAATAVADRGTRRRGQRSPEEGEESPESPGWSLCCPVARDDPDRDVSYRDDERDPRDDQEDAPVRLVHAHDFFLSVPVLSETRTPAGLFPWLPVALGSGDRGLAPIAK